jgi:hypothetical protein
MASWQNQAFHKKGFHVSPTRRASMSRIGYYKNSRRTPEPDRTIGHEIICRSSQRNAHHGNCARTIFDERRQPVPSCRHGLFAQRKSSEAGE